MVHYLMSLLKITFFVFLFMLLLFKMAPKYSAKVLTSVSKRKAVICVTVKICLLEQALERYASTWLTFSSVLTN